LISLSASLARPLLFLSSMMTRLPRAFRSASPWLPLIVAALLLPACLVPLDEESDEPTEVTSQPLDFTDSIVDGGQEDAPSSDGTCNTPECLKLGGARQ
jgi:hypothetical protein